MWRHNGTSWRRIQNVKKSDTKKLHLRRIPRNCVYSFSFTKKTEKGRLPKMGPFRYCLGHNEAAKSKVESGPVSSRIARLTVQMEWYASSEELVRGSSLKIFKEFKHSRQIYILELRIWSWFRLNAGGVDETCKSNGKRSNPLSVAKGLGIYEQSTFYLGITAGNGR